MSIFAPGSANCLRQCRLKEGFPPVVTLIAVRRFTRTGNAPIDEAALSSAFESKRVRVSVLFQFVFKFVQLTRQFVDQRINCRIHILVF